MNIASPRIEDLAQRLARATGESVETAVERAIQERLSRVSPSVATDRQAAMDRLLSSMARLPILDHRTPDEIIGYGPDGLPE